MSQNNFTAKMFSLLGGLYRRLKQKVIKIGSWLKRFFLKNFKKFLCGCKTEATPTSDEESEKVYIVPLFLTPCHTFYEEITDVKVINPSTTSNPTGQNSIPPKTVNNDDDATDVLEASLFSSVVAIKDEEKPIVCISNMKESSVVPSTSGDNDEDSVAADTCTKPELIDGQSETQTLQMAIANVKSCLTEAISEFSPTTYNQLRGSFSTTIVNDSQKTLWISEGCSARTTSFTNLGLPNLSYTCYMNAALQALLTLKGFIDMIYRQKHVWGQHPNSVGFQQILSVLNCQFEPDSRKRHRLSVFKQTVADFNTEFSDNHQKDAHEFMMCVLDILQSSKSDMQAAASALNTRYFCPVDAHIGFQMMNIRTCSGCGSESKNVENYISMSLNLKAGASVDKCLLENLKGGCVEFSCKCGYHESSQKALFVSLPNVLILQLQRFTSKKYNIVKDNRAVYLGQNLKIPANFCINATKSVQYSLVSIVSHLGSSAKYGHYICDGVNRQQSQSPESWLTYDDNVVTETSMQDVLYKRKPSAYMLLYERQNSLLKPKSKSV